jgi:hypothetical protein
MRNTYFCELATLTIKKAQRDKKRHASFVELVSQYKKAIRQLKSYGVGRFDYSNRKIKDINGRPHEVIDLLELPNGSGIRNWPTVLSVEIDDDDDYQSELGEKFKTEEMLAIAFKDLKKKEALRARQFWNALG